VEVPAARRRSYLSHALSQASPVQSVELLWKRSRCKSEPPGDRSGLWSAVCLFVIQHVRAKTSPTHADGTGGAEWDRDFGRDIPTGRRLRGRARRARENRRRESAFSRFAGVGQVGRFALDPPPISCSPPLASATVQQSTVDTCARSRLESAGSDSWHYTVLLMLEHQFSRTIETVS